MPRKFNVATAAGTFDCFHKGHEHFLHAAFDAADTIYIAITSDAFAKSSRQLPDITPFVKRKKAIENFLNQRSLLKRAKIFQLHDIYGPTLESDCLIEAVVVTKKTRYGAELINNLRKQKGLSALAIIEVTFMQAADGGEISSSRIRAGEIDRIGNVWVKKEWLEKDLRLPDEIRPMLQKPIGELIGGSEEDLGKAVSIIKQRIHSRGGTLIITVGDVVAKSFNEGELSMDIAIVDFYVKREERFKNVGELGFSKGQPDGIVDNPKGMLTGKLFKAVKEVFFCHPELVSGSRKMPKQVRHDNEKPYIIRVIGEEDLVTLAVILAAPLGTIVYYGQPNEGIVEVIVTEEKKAEIQKIVSQFVYQKISENIIF